MQGDVAQRGSVTMLAGHSGTPSYVCQNVGVPPFTGSTAVTMFHASSNHLEFLFIAP
jgi:hypothetical protein